MARLAHKRQPVQAVLSGVSALVTKRSADIQGFALNRRTSGRLGVDGLRGGLRNVMRLYNGTTVLVRVTVAEKLYSSALRHCGGRWRPECRRQRGAEQLPCE